MLKVLVIDDEVFVRKGIVMETDWASLDCMVAGEAANGRSANCGKRHDTRAERL